MTWLDTFERIDATKPGGTFTCAPWRIALHSTEGPTIDSALAAFRATGSWPQITADPNTRRKIQHYSLDTSARALMHPPGTPETNRANAIQIEIVGNAVDMPNLSVDDLAWLGAEVLAPIRAVCPFALTAPGFVRYPDSYGAGAPQRFTWNQWATYSGIVGHQHVPGNDHGDPGAIDVAAILAAITPAPTPADTEDDVAKFHYAQDTKNRLWLVNLGTTAKQVHVFADADYEVGKEGHSLFVPEGAAEIGPDTTGAKRQGQKLDAKGEALYGIA